MQSLRDALTGTFFCVTTTAQFFPRTPTDVMLAAVMALKAYSEGQQWSEAAQRYIR